MKRKNVTGLGGFTLVELIIVIAIIAVLAAAIIPQMIGFDKEARVATTKSNLETIRSRVALFRAKEGRYPANLNELTTEDFEDGAATLNYLSQIPPEMVSSASGAGNSQASVANSPMSNGGGWVYNDTNCVVQVNYKTPLTVVWGEYSNQNPSSW